MMTGWRSSPDGQPTFPAMTRFAVKCRLTPAVCASLPDQAPAASTTASAFRVPASVSTPAMRPDWVTMRRAPVLSSTSTPRSAARLASSWVASTG